MKKIKIILSVIAVFIIIYALSSFVNKLIPYPKPHFVEKWKYSGENYLDYFMQDKENLLATYTPKTSNHKLFKYNLLLVDKKTGNLKKEIAPIDFEVNDKAHRVDRIEYTDNDLFVLYTYNAEKLESVICELKKFNIKKEIEEWKLTLPYIYFGYERRLKSFQNGIIFSRSNKADTIILSCLSSDTGVTLWEDTSLRGEAATPLVIDNKLFIASESQKEDRNAGNDCFMSCFDLDAGKMIWQTKLPDEAYWLRGKPLYFKGRVYITTLGNFYGLDPKTGKVKFKLQNKVLTLNPFAQYFVKFGMNEIRFGSEGTPTFDEKSNLVYFSNYPSMAFSLRTGWLKKIYPEYWFPSGKKISKVFLISTVYNEANRKKYFKDAHHLEWKGNLIVLDKYLITYQGIFDKHSGRFLEKLPCGGAKDMLYDHKTNTLCVLTDKSIYVYKVKLE